jgi:glycine/D-amino acid oxidase-like deaminating enzyme
MPALLVVGGGLFGSLAAAWARRHGIEARVFDAAECGAASPAAAGLFREAWCGRRFAEHYRPALALLEQLTEVRSVGLARDDGRREQLLCVPPAAVLEPDPVRQRVTAIGDGWLEADGVRHHGWVYVAAGVWSGALVPELGVYGKAGAALVFRGEQPGRIRALAPGRQAIAFVRDPGRTYFSDGTAERDYTALHDQQTRDHARALGLLDEPIERCWGRRPYVPGGPVFRRLGARTWVGTGGRKLGTVLGAALARRLVEELLSSPV